MKEIKKCLVCGSTTKVCNTEMGFLCGRHYNQFKRHSKISERTSYDSNEIKIKDDYAVITLYDKNSNPKAETLVDISDIDIIKGFKWSIDNNNYVKNSKQIYLHRLLMNASELCVDHINGNTLDNRRSNLRICTNADNLKHRVSLPKNNTSGILGVRFRKDRNKWYAEIQSNKQKINLGSYTSREDAIKARLEAEIKYFGNYKSEIK